MTDPSWRYRPAAPCRDHSRSQRDHTHARFGAAHAEPPQLLLEEAPERLAPHHQDNRVQGRINEGAQHSSDVLNHVLVPNEVLIHHGIRTQEDGQTVGDGVVHVDSVAEEEEHREEEDRDCDLALSHRVGGLVRPLLQNRSYLEC